MRPSIVIGALAFFSVGIALPQGFWNKASGGAGGMNGAAAPAGAGQTHDAPGAPMAGAGGHGWGKREAWQNAGSPYANNGGGRPAGAGQPNGGAPAGAPMGNAGSHGWGKREAWEGAANVYGGNGGTPGGNSQSGQPPGNPNSGKPDAGDLTNHGGFWTGKGH